jgi:hypothetical protein
MNPKIQDIVDVIEQKFGEIKSQTESSYKELDEKLDARFTPYEDSWERRFADLVVSHDTRMCVLECAASTFEDWSTSMEGTVDDIKLEVGKLPKHLERSMHERSPPLIPLGTSLAAEPKTTPAVNKMLLPYGDLKSSSASGRPSAADIADRPNRHILDNQYREGGYGSVTTIVHPPVKGACPLPIPPSKSYSSPIPGSEYRPRSASPLVSGGVGRLPKLNFPSFDGNNPKLWLSRCLDYFELYDFEEPRWTMVATMHFIPPATHWLPSVEPKLKSCSWLQFSSILLERFGRDQHEILVRHLLNIKQLGTVSDYIEKFSKLLGQLAAYQGPSNPLHHTMRFIYGLRDDLKFVVLIQRPHDLDTTFVISQLQEELHEASGKKREYMKSDSSYSSKPYFKSSLPAPPSSYKHNKTATSSSEDKRLTKSARASNADDKWRSLKAFRRAKGLCQYCAEKWSKDHKCTDNIQLQVDTSSNI